MDHVDHDITKLIESYKQAGIRNINPNELLHEKYNPNQEDESCYYDWKMYTTVTNVNVHDTILNMLIQKVIGL